MKMTKIISFIVISAGIAVILGWVFDIQLLKSFSPHWATMKFTTAMAFVFSGLTLFLLALAGEGKQEIAQVGLAFSTLAIILVMGTIFFSYVFEVRTGVEDLFVKEASGAVKSVIPGRPSLVTVINFLLIAGAGLLTMFNPPRLKMGLKGIGLVVGLSGLSALAGYLGNLPLLYFYIAGLSTAMAIHTGILFAVIGAGFLCL